MKAAQHPVVCFGEVLWDLLPSGEKPGGAPMNVAYHLKKLGINPALITRIGKDSHGKRLLELLEYQGLDTGYIQKDEEHPTGLVHARLKEQNEMEYEIAFPSAWDFIQPEKRFEELVHRADYFVFGSLANRNPVSRKTLLGLLEAARTRVLDINLRPPHYDRPLIEELISRCQILKLNEHELPLIAGWYKKLDQDTDQILLLQDRFRLHTIIVTRGGEGAMVYRDGKMYQHPGYPVAVKDTVGSGDAFLAGFISRIMVGQTVELALEFANRLGAFIATQEGACPVYEPERVEMAER